MALLLTLLFQFQFFPLLKVYSNEDLLCISSLHMKLMQYGSFFYDC